MNKLIFSALMVFGLTSQAIGAQTQPLKVSEQSQVSVAKPRHGQSMDQVANSFGEPIEKFNAVGEPPITRWRYAEFTVYFEHDKVIHSVSHRS